ncbi:MAG: tetratricopeptide repeat-containing sensor histidine kinase [Bacteroidia bacterium]
MTRSLAAGLPLLAGHRISLLARVVGAWMLLIAVGTAGLVAQTRADTLYRQLRTVTDGREKAKVLVELIDLRKYVSTDTPMVWSHELLELGKQLHDPGIESDALVQMAWIYRTIGNHTSAIDCAAQSIQKAEQVHDRLREAKGLLELGVIEREQGNYAEAEASLAKGLAAFQQENNPLGQGRCTNALGEIARLQKRYDEARDAYKRTRVFYTQAGYYAGIFVEQNNDGLILEAEGKYEQALDSLSMSSAAGERLDFVALFLESTVSMARCYLKLGQLDDAEKYAEIVFRKAEAASQKKYASSAAKTLADVYVAQKDYPKAMTYLTRHYELASEIVNSASQTRIKSLRFDHQLREKEAEIQVLNKDRQIRQLWSVLAVAGLALVCIVGVVLLVSYRRKLRDNALLAAQNDALAELILEKDSLINIVAHDLKSPLNKTQGLMELLGTLGELNPQQQKIAAMIDAVLTDGDRLIRDLLDISQVEGNQSSLSLSDFDLGALLTTQIASIRESAAKKRITLDYQAPASAILVHSDKSFVSRVFDNLVSNAIKYSPSGTTVHLACGQSGNQVWFSVKDEGPGFSPDDQKKMYRKFQRLSARPTGGEGSNGLGLSIIRLLVTQLKGEVKLTSERGKGAEFVVTIPARLG